jgi:hypothetical protein
MSTFKGIVCLAGLYRRSEVLRRPTRPWLIDLTVLRPYEGLAPGDVADFETAPDMELWRIGNTPTDAAQQLQWVCLEDQGRQLLISDRVLLMRISWDDLEAAGYVTGRAVTIDGRRYLCRLLSGGSSFRSADDGYAGGWPLANEWDRYISAEAPTTGLPKPSASDLDESLDAADLQSEHNALWNWFGAVSWTREPYAQRESARCCRGYRSARYFYLNTQSHRHEDIGWRPVLEALE